MRLTTTIRRLFHQVKSTTQFTLLKQKLKGKPFIIDFYANWCGPCKVLGPIITERQEKGEGKWALVKVDCDLQENAQLCQQHQIQALPTLIVFDKDGNKFHTHLGGCQGAAIDEMIHQVL